MADPLSHAQLVWREGLPYASDYGDSYFGSDNPHAEAREVFIEANDLPRRFARAGRFVLGETGFGTGLNILLALAEWRRQAPPGAFLSLFSLDAHPLAAKDLARVHRHLGLDDPDSAALRAQYPPPVSGLHRIHFPGGDVVLTLGFGDAAPLLAHVRGRVDAWFLDGFAPRTNPGLWNTGVFQQLARLSRPGTTFGTYTAAGQVRRDLEATGFAVQRVPGHGPKRERLTGRFGGTETTDPETGVRPRILVAGAGIAGLTSALALQDRGCEVTVTDPAGIAGGASGNPAAVLLPHLKPHDPDSTDLALAGMRATHGLLERLRATRGGGTPDPFLAEGVAFHGVSAHTRKRVQRLRSRGPEQSGFLFVPDGPSCADTPHLYYPDGCGVNLAAFCTALGKLLPPVRNAALQAIHPQLDGLEAVTDSPLGETSWDAIVIATAACRGTSLCPEQANLSSVVGQMTQLRAPLPDWGGFVATGQGYCIPGANGQAWIGATYRRTAAAQAIHDDRPDPADDQHNLRHLAWVPGLEDSAAVSVVARWTGTRTVARDRLPLVGTSRADPDHRLLLSLAHGSRGLLYAPLSAQFLADHLLGLPEPLATPVSARLDPARLEHEPRD
ncbi:MAG: tRNA (5-methylaminomethyl-2-thiouridine)(34)-methyltransferase MnmD [Pseudomonadota bacterium]